VFRVGRPLVTMRILVTSDTHAEDPDDLTLPIAEADAVVHAGDFSSSEVLMWFDEKARTLHAVHGNADDTGVRDALPRRTVFEAEGVRVTVVHGHRHSADEIGYVGAEEGAHIVVRGHTHTPSYKERGVPVLNPGSPTRPRGSPPSYAWLFLYSGRYGGSIVTSDGDVLEDFGEVEEKL